MLQLRSCFRVSVRIFGPTHSRVPRFMNGSWMRFVFVVGLLLFLSLAGAAKGQQSNQNAYDVALRLLHWTNLLLKVSVRKPNQDELRQQNDSPDHYKYFAVRRDLNEQELTDTGNWVLENVPMPPSLPPMLCKACGLPPETVSFHLEIVLEAVKLNADGPEQIVGSIRNSNDDGPVFGISRVFLLQKENGRLRLRWISPLLRALDQRVSYLDVDADGTVEICSSSCYMAGNREAWALSIFDSTGRELTRAAGDCQLAVSAQGEEATTYLPAACPICGRPDVEHALDSDGKIVLKAVTDFPYETQEDRTYKFVTGRYVRVKKTKSKP